jgi:ribosomal silencing factor RsfS
VDGKDLRIIKYIYWQQTAAVRVDNVTDTFGTVLIATSERDLQALVDVVNEESKKKGLGLNQKKTEGMVISKKDIQQTCKIEVEETTLTQVKSFKYMGTTITADGKSNTQVKNRVAQAKTAFHKMKKRFYTTERYHWRPESKYY